MNDRLKFGIYIIFIFILGLAIGILLNRALLQKRIKDMLIMRASGRIVPQLEEIVKPENPEQWTLIREILDKYETKMAEIHLRFREEIEAAFKSLKADVDPLLTSEQKKRLEDMLPKPPPFLKREPRGFGLPPGGPGPSPGLPPGPFRGRSVEEELAFLADELILTAEQADKVKAILKDYEDRAKPQMEKPGFPEEFKAVMRLREERDKEIEKVLTREQAEKWRARRPGDWMKRREPPPPRGPEGPPPF
jgi:Spy/CpxP family protein refolding chaperone